ncbi:hypothetical protein GX48_08250 [Paracoccidioides brasiliensis]|nr:hypothetical protein GX48_08250 [Paracoccidioides brasiliensis]
MGPVLNLARGSNIVCCVVALRLPCVVCVVAAVLELGRLPDVIIEIKGTERGVEWTIFDLLVNPPLENIEWTCASVNGTSVFSLPDFRFIRNSIIFHVSEVSPGYVRESGSDPMTLSGDRYFDGNVEFAMDVGGDLMLPRN